MAQKRGFACLIVRFIRTWERASKSGEERVQKVFWTQGARVSQESFAHHPKPVLHQCDPIRHQCKRLFTPLAENTFCALSEPLSGVCPFSALSHILWVFSSDLQNGEGMLMQYGPSLEIAKSLVWSPWVFMDCHPPTSRPYPAPSGLFLLLEREQIGVHGTVQRSSGAMFGRREGWVLGGGGEGGLHA